MTTAPAPSRTARAVNLLPPTLRRRAARLPGALAPPVPAGTPTPRIAIIGTGFGGLGMAARLRQAGIETFTIYEKADDLGGTWRDNTYPGAACDVPSHLYSLSFAPKSDWTRRFPEQAEILEYLHDVAERFHLGPHIRFGAELDAATWDEDEGVWHLELSDGTTDDVDVLVSATGQLNRPHIPEIPGLDTFEGTTFHSARWDHDHDLTGRHVAVVGIGASAIQFVPVVAEHAAQLTLFQRSVNYVGPKPDGAFSDRTKAVFRRVPLARRLYRFSIWARFDARWAWFRQNSRSGALVQGVFDKSLRKLVSDDLPEDAVIPRYPFGCKRILISNDWFPTLLRANVRLVTDPIDQVDASGITAGETTTPVDTIIFGTGFESTGFLAPIRITGRDGRDLHAEWADGAEAHLGITVSGFPNLFLLYGPNTNLGHNSIVVMLERQIAYIQTCIRSLVEERSAWLDVKPDAQAESNAQLRDELNRTVWAAACHSWYKTATGRITNNWSGTTVRYWRRTAYPRFGDYFRQPRTGG